jgi:hypothetical protein
MFRFLPQGTLLVQEFLGNTEMAGILEIRNGDY